MTMFEELYALATSATLTMVLSADEKTGRMTINVIPKPRKDMDETALTQALSLTATPAEFDAEFVDVLKGYREVRQSLAEQAEATQEVLQAAKTASAKKAGDAMTKAAKPAPATPASKAPVKVPGSAASDPEDEDGDGDEATGGAARPTATPTGSDSMDLFG